MRKAWDLLASLKDKILLNEVDAVMHPLIAHLKSYLPADETTDNFDYYMFEALLEVFGFNGEKARNSQIVATAKRYFEYFNTRGSSNTIRMAVKFLVFTVKNLRLVHQTSIHNHKISYYFYHIRTANELNKIHAYINEHASSDSLAAQFICPLTQNPITTPIALRKNISHELMHPHYEYTLYELSAVHDLIFFQGTDINPITKEYIGSSNLLLEIDEIKKIFINYIEDLKSYVFKPS
jgi:hypothetical protein